MDFGTWNAIAQRYLAYARAVEQRMQSIEDCTGDKYADLMARTARHYARVERHLDKAFRLKTSRGGSISIHADV